MVKVVDHDRKRKKKWCVNGCGKCVVFSWHKRKIVWKCTRCGKINCYGGIINEIKATAVYLFRKITHVGTSKEVFKQATWEVNGKRVL